MKLPETFWSKVIKTESCWRWTGARNKRGYGLFNICGKLQSAHRLAWSEIHGAIGAGLYICHKCDNPSCVNPDHLFAGSARENQVDSSLKGRTARQKIDHRQAMQIFHFPASNSETGKRFGVSKNTVTKIRTRKTWAWIHHNSGVPPL